VAKRLALSPLVPCRAMPGRAEHKGGQQPLIAKKLVASSYPYLALVTFFWTVC